MSFKNISILHVLLSKDSVKIPVGRLALKERQILFEYAPDFLKTGIELSPFKLPLKSGLLICHDSLFDGVFGVFNDSLPDGWGRLLLDRKLMALGLNPGELSPLDRLRYVGSQGMGALIYEPEIELEGPCPHENWDEIEDEVLQFQNNNDDRFVDDLLALNGSSAGARPKILVQIDGQDWLIKFRSSLDPKDIGAIEHAYHLMAKEAGLNVPKARLFESKRGPGYFGSKRFDRVDGQRFHMHTVSGLLHVDHRIPTLDYETIMKATLWLTKDMLECEKQFRLAVFNVLSNNRDDHAKNFSFLMNSAGEWKVSPAYDLTFSFGPAGEHCTTVVGEGKSPGIDHLLKLAEISGLKTKTAIGIIDNVQSAVSKWAHFAQESGVSKTSSGMILKKLKA